MYLVDDDIAWVLPHRTAARYTFNVIEKYCTIERGDRLNHRAAKKELLGDRKLYINVRNPYTRIQSYWRLLQRVEDQNKIIDYLELDFESYILRLRDVERFTCTGSIHYNLHEGLKYPLALTHYLGDCQITRVDKLIRFESLYQDLEYVGFYPVFEKYYGWGYRSDLHLDWYDNHKECAEIVTRLYKKDFKIFNYALIV